MREERSRQAPLPFHERRHGVRGRVSRTGPGCAARDRRPVPSSYLALQRHSASGSVISEHILRPGRNGAVDRDHSSYPAESRAFARRMDSRTITGIPALTPIPWPIAASNPTKYRIDHSNSSFIACLGAISEPKGTGDPKINSSSPLQPKARQAYLATNSASLRCPSTECQYGLGEEDEIPISFLGHRHEVTLEEPARF